ncbi:MAG TPA: GTP cyclohydrolase I FolE [Candidatus Marinimicrobia bacterium]|jgi:GTP cyclohydrolase I|nr:GTP cyclohydrolase I FolE [Candidatus Neomarinimicrobiota bacterium]MDP7166083.1 GTP cyclohydrolase I FolE [Candidatus Neomarinimicrobiota bacterium]HBR86835.1 GTP cyclohydrolase I FolE [Candidatus Neomarinimicrobiota bacterium]HJL63496.1 GTP cyclohydrolase I FolE [Candidatus Neomarinimicrobiota bacterium]HJM11722.1 GTP cyclohydrolase I FolE [Candidatus Neomarinimicrobiota bacterium]|tara:strand:+ start:478 stop:1047 length:570 start_codon:yes stop_codon:yes gene_type:complete
MKDHNNLKEITRSLLKEIGEDPNRDGLLKTPERVAKAWDFFSQGYDTDIQSIVNGAIFEEDCSEMVVVRDIEFFSMCEHHLIPFFGRCHVGYLPNKKIIGLSKIPRIVDAFAQRLQVQERLTGQVAETLMDILDPKGVGVVMEGRHLCMQMRGVEKQNSFATTSAMLGQFRDSAETRSEFLSIIRMKQF